MMRTPILALLLIAALAAPALAAPGNGSGNANGSGNGNGNSNSGGGGTTSPGNSNSEKKVTKVPNDGKVARDAIRKHQVLSLDEVTVLIGKTTKGRVLDIELVRLDGALTYEVTVLEADGRLHKLYYNAGSGTLMDDR